jgi:hypothetical protein
MVNFRTDYMYVSIQLRQLTSDSLAAGSAVEVFGVHEADFKR